MEMPSCYLSTQARDSSRLVGHGSTYTLANILAMRPADHGMRITVALPWLTIDRLRSGRDIRLSTATMRALHSRRPRLTSTSYLLPRPLLCLVLLFSLLDLDAVRARGVPRDEEDAEQRGGEFSGVETEGDAGKEVDVSELVKDTSWKSDRVDGEDGKIGVGLPSTGRKISDPGIGDVARSETGVIQGQLGDNGLVSVEEETKEVGRVEEAEEKKFIGSYAGSEVLEGNSELPSSEDDEGSVAKKRRRNDVVQMGKSGVREGEDIGEIKDEGIRRFDARVDADDEASPVENSEEGIVRVGSRKRMIDVRQFRAAKDGEGLNTEEDSEQRENLRSSGKIEGNEDQDEVVSSESENPGEDEPEGSSAGKGYRYLDENEGKSRYKSSTVYLNAEEKISGGEQTSIVDGQIKKLISIRDDALDSRNVENLDEAKVLVTKDEVGPEEVAFAGKEIRGEGRSGSKETSALESNEGFNTNEKFVKKWRDQALKLQDQIKNRTFLNYLRDQATEVLPEVPKFTENQLLNTLKRIVSSKKPDPSSETYATNVNDPSLTESQLQIIKCAEQLVAVKQRQSFVTNMFDCIRGLSVLNCMRIFIWPIVADNLPESINQNLANLPIEINLFDLFQGNGAKSAKSRDLEERVKLLAPETVVFAILKDALQSYSVNDRLPTFVDPKNETLRKLLTEGQVEILRMGEKLLPVTVRREYSDRMFSCVRRFEYFSCVKYFAWPMVKQYLPTLPAFPDYQTWYPSVSPYPEYPILPFPGFAEGTGELPEVVEADATRTRKPRPEAIIVQILQDTLKDQPKATALPTFLDQSTDSYVALIPQEQLLSIHMAEQLVPVSYRPEFVEKTIKCIREYNYLTCFKYSTWPTVRQFMPTLPDISGLIPDFQIPNLSDIFGYFPSLPTLPGLPSLPSLPSLPDLSTFWPGGGTPDQPMEIPTSPTVLREVSESSIDLEKRILEILLMVRDSLGKTTEVPSLIVNGNVIFLTTITERQLGILRVAESLVAPNDRTMLVTRVLLCLQSTYDFANCTKFIVWPSVARYIPNLPEFPKLEKKEQESKEKDREEATQEEESLNSSDKVQEGIISDIVEKCGIKITSRTPLQDDKFLDKPQTVPVISVTDTRFVPIFTEHPESVIFNILRSVQLASPNAKGETTVSSTKTQQFIDLLNQQQENIVRITESLLPEAVRPAFVSRMIDCVRESNFVACSRDVLWPTLVEYFPRLPNFPNFGPLSNTPSNGSISSNPTQNLTESSSNSEARPLSETNVKTGQHGDATVTITDTRFFPILNELPETVILNILKAVQLSTPNLSSAPVPARTQAFSGYLTEQQINIMQVAESLLPVSMRQAFVERTTMCFMENSFLDCTRDIIWPTVAQFFPRLPNFPNFGSFQNLPRTRQTLLDDSSLEKDKLEDQSSDSNLNEKEGTYTMGSAEEKLESILKKTLEKSPRLEQSYLNAEDPAISSRLTDQEINIVRLVESGIPDPARATYISRMLECVRNDNFIACTQSVSWPSLKQYYPTLPSFPNFGDLLPQLPGLPQIPDLGQLPTIPGLGGSPFQELPGIPQLPGGFPQLPAGFPQLPGGFPELPGGFPELPTGFPQFPPGISQLQEGISQLPGLPQYATSRSKSPQGETPPRRPAILNSAEEEGNVPGSSAITSSVDSHEAVPGYAGQPTGIFLDFASERIQLPDDPEVHEEPRIKAAETSRKDKSRRRRSTIELVNSYHDVNKQAEKSPPSMAETFPNITDSEFLQLLINVTKEKRYPNKSPVGESKKYYVDTLNSTIRSSLTADQYESLKIVEDLNSQTSDRGFLSRVIQCIRSLSFIRCMGIFVWPIISNNVPSLISLPSLPSIPTFGIFGRSMETEVQDFFGMSTVEFEKELLTRKQSIEHFLVDWYKKLIDGKFQTRLGFLNIRGYGNGELGISFSSFREGRATKIKDNKNLPSILTIISDIMEEVLDQRPDNDKTKKEKDKKKKSIEDSRDADIQFLKDTEEYVDIKRSINDDDQLITMFLEKVRSNASDADDGASKQYLNLEDAYNAFEVLFGTRLNEKLATRLQVFNDRLRSFEGERPNEPTKERNTLESKRKNSEEVKIPSKSQMTYDLERESSRDQKERQRQKRAKNFFKSILEKYSDKYLKDTRADKLEDDVEENEINNSGKLYKKRTSSEVIVELPRLNEEILPRKITSSMVHLGRGFKTKMMQLMPGIGLVLSFLLQMALAHARAAASMAGMLSNMALGSAMFGMIRQAVFGSSTHPKIKYVYDNDKMGQGIAWPNGYGPEPLYRV